ncbi:uncharacterized protein [Eucyclogobius newberryi]|uniref:uncharacterized protein n=1 Tax=Eucyclogobius newberryi TaxID=166745 RepID=UPI003B5A21CB
MDVSWSPTPCPEAFKRPSTAADTLTRLASFIARAESKPGLSRTHQPAPLHSPLHSPPSPPPFSCSECGLSFTFGTELLLHQDAQHAQLPKPHRCARCRHEFSLKSSLQMHNCHAFPGRASDGPTYATSLTNIGPNPTHSSAFPGAVDAAAYACAPCGRGFTHKQALLHHQQAGCDATRSPRRSDRPGTADAVVSEGESSSSSSNSSCALESVCKFCSRTFQDVAAFHRHKQMKRCDKKETGLNSADPRPRKSKRDGFSCRSCDMVFNCTAKLYHHRKETHSRGVQFMEAPPLAKRKHKRPNRNYTCQICSAVFLHHLSLWAHSRKHPARINGEDAGAAANATGKSDTPATEKKVAPLKITIRKSVWTKEVSLGKKDVVLKLHKIPKFATTLKPSERETAPEENEEEEAEFPCPSCPEVFSQLADLVTHSELHQTAATRGKCGVCSCDMDSSNWGGAKRPRLYHCALCQRGFTTLDLFLSHCQGHLKAKVDEEAAPDA